MRRLVVNSRQAKHPHGGLAWVQNTLRAVEDIARKGDELVASVGTSAWELPLAAAAMLGAKVTLVCPMAKGVRQEDARELITEQFALAKGQVTWHWAIGHGRSAKSAWNTRDLDVLSLADMVMVVSVRGGGRWEWMLAEGHKPIAKDYEVSYEETRLGPGWQERSPIDLNEDLWPSGSIVHLTRACDGPWPGETRVQYYADVIASKETDPRGALATLTRMLEQSLIKGSLFRARGGVPRVCFTQSTPRQVIELVRYRKRYARYCFEPYGIALSPRVATQIAKPVCYSDDSTIDWLLQAKGRKGDWTAEREWRVLGDLQLGTIDPEEITVIVAMERDAKKVRQQYPYKVVNLGYACM